jgi:hypothetical protein
VAWLRVRGDRESDLPDYLPDWDAATDIHLRAALRIDIDGLRADTGLPEDGVVSCFLGWKSRATTLRGGVSIQQLPISGDHEFNIDLTLPGAKVGGSVDLSLSLLLGNDLPHMPFTAHIAGSLIWETLRRLDLEGSSGRFPIEVVDFASLPGRDARAGWYLDWDPGDLSMPLLGGLRLLVNSTRPRVVSAIVTGSIDADARAIRDAIMLDAARSLVAGAMANGELTDESSFEEDSVGEAVLRLTRAAFDRRSLTTLKAAYLNRAADLDHRLQGHLNTFSEQG